MKKLISSISAATLVVSCASMAWADSRIQSTVSVAPETKLTEQEQDSVRLAAARLLLHVDQARQDLKKKDVNAAQKNVTQALLLGDIIKSVMPAYKIKCDVKAGNTEYVDESEVKPLLVTLEEDLGEIAVLEPVRAAKRVAHQKAAKPQERLTDIELAEARAQLDVNLAISQLNEAKAALAANNIETADQALNSVLTDVDFQYAVADLPVGQPESAHKTGSARTSARREGASKSKASGTAGSSRSL